MNHLYMVKYGNSPFFFNKKFCSESFVAVKGKVVKYRDRLELNILNINSADIKLYSRYGFKEHQ